MTDLSGKVALVTGASRGIGAGIAEALAAHGAAVGVNYANGQKEADAVVARIVAAGGRAIPVQADVSKAADVERMTEQVAEALGPVTILVNNAGLTDTHRPWQTITEEDWDRVIDVNLKSCYLTLRATYPFMKEAEWGRIINISSVTFHLGMKNLLLYVSSKGGMIGFTRTLALIVDRHRSLLPRPPNPCCAPRMSGPGSAARVPTPPRCPAPPAAPTAGRPAR